MRAIMESVLARGFFVVSQIRPQGCDLILQPPPENSVGGRAWGGLEGGVTPPPHPAAVTLSGGYYACGPHA